MSIDQTALQEKYDNIIRQFAELSKLPEQEAKDFFYSSSLHSLLASGLAEIQHMSDSYFAAELLDEYYLSMVDDM